MGIAAPLPMAPAHHEWRQMRSRRVFVEGCTGGVSQQQMLFSTELAPAQAWSAVAECTGAFCCCHAPCRHFAHPLIQPVHLASPAHVGMARLQGLCASFGGPKACVAPDGTSRSLIRGMTVRMGGGHRCRHRELRDVGVGTKCCRSGGLLCAWGRPTAPHALPRLSPQRLSMGRAQVQLLTATHP